jgi:hypothetical protein
VSWPEGVAAAAAVIGTLAALLTVVFAWRRARHWNPKLENA